MHTVHQFLDLKMAFKAKRVYAIKLSFLISFCRFKTWLTEQNKTKIFKKYASVLEARL